MSFLSRQIFFLWQFSAPTLTVSEFTFFHYLSRVKYERLRLCRSSRQYGSQLKRCTTSWCDARGISTLLVAWRFLYMHVYIGHDCLPCARSPTRANFRRIFLDRLLCAVYLFLPQTHYALPPVFFLIYLCAWRSSLARATLIRSGFIRQLLRRIKIPFPNWPSRLVHSPWWSPISGQSIQR